MPVVVMRQFDQLDEERLTLYAATDVGGLLIEGFGDGCVTQYRKRGGCR